MIKPNKKEFLICGGLLTIGFVLFCSLYLTSVYPFTEGWGIYYAELLDRGQIPYRDFFYYLPPLNLILDWGFWKLSFGNLLMFRIWYIVQRYIMVVLLYKLLTKWFQPRYAWFACLTTSILRTATVFDLGGDYNQTQTLLAVLLIYAVVWFLEKSGDVNGIMHYKYIFLAGIILSSMVLLKQSSGLAALLISFAFLVVYCIAFKEKRFVGYLIATALGALIPLGICFGYLIINGAFLPFFEQFFGVAGAKGGVGTILIDGWQLLFTSWTQIIFYINLIFFFRSTLRAIEGKLTKQIYINRLILFLLTSFFCFGNSIRALGYLISESTFFIVILLVLAAIFCIFTIDSIKEKLPILRNLTDSSYAVYSAISFLIVFVLVRENIRNLTTDLATRTGLFHDVTAAFTYISIYTSILFLVLEFVTYAKKGTFLFPKAMIFVFVGGLADAYANMMNSSGYIYPISAFILAPLVLLLLYTFEMGKWTHLKNMIICLCCVILCTSVMVQKYTTAYSWWGSETTYPLHQRTYSVDLEEMRGLKLAKQRKLEFEKVTKLIEENSDKDDTVWGFPHVKIFNILTDHYNLDEPVPVLFYDVCTDEAAAEELKWLKANNPEIVVWCDMPGCLKTHEQVFRNGNELGQRKIVEWFTEVRKTKYEKIGQVGNLFVYKLKDGTEPNYTYFQNKKARNKTIDEPKVKKTTSEEEDTSSNESTSSNKSNSSTKKESSKSDTSKSTSSKPTSTSKTSHN